jgi:hypothetical protein
VTLRARTVAQKGELARAVRKHVWPLLESGAVRVPVHTTFPLRGRGRASCDGKQQSHRQAGADDLIVAARLGCWRLVS